MAKFSGEIGYVITTDKGDGVFEEVATERTYYGDVLRNVQRWEKGEGVNDNLTINNQISIVADDFAYSNFAALRYVKWMQVSWKVTSVEVQRPRLLLTIGGVYNGS